VQEALGSNPSAPTNSATSVRLHTQYRK